MAQLRRLLPDPEESLTPREALAGLALGDRAPEDRPYVAINFVSSVDGRAAFEGRSGALGDEVDRELFLTLREHVDAVMAGTGTLRAERYGQLVRDPERRSARERAGLRPQPLAVVVSRSLHVPTDIPLFQEPDCSIVVYTAAEADLPDCPADVHVVRLDPAEMTMTAALRDLRAEHGVRSLLCEGGPTVFGALVHERAADELFLTLSPKLAGGTDPLTILQGPPMPEPAELELAWVLEAGGALFLRYRLTLT
jgi:5-amino-6-(5-phosphoribosylamino)uracil reductase